MAITSAGLSAVQAYGAISRLGQTGKGPDIGGAAGATPQGLDFGSLVENAIQGVVDKGKASEMAQGKLLQGKADVVDVVTAVAESETAMQTLVSVRDRVISAYEEIMKMSI